jgi:predicted molibdopterin-dependent oxidoreductase YjgC
MTHAAITVTVIEETEVEAQPPVHPDLDLSLFDPFQKLVQIEVLGKKFNVPENNTLMRCFQYFAFEPISYGGFCWNGTCRLCEIDYQLPDGRKRQCLSCCTKVVDGMEIVKTTEELRFE